jgi:hypothetical protein
MEYFARLVRAAYQHWSLHHYDVLEFSNSAVAALHELPPSQHLSAHAIARWIATCTSLPVQIDPSSTFGEPPVTVFNDGTVAVDLYFWLTATTAIHDHGFAGAFAVVEGQSIEVEYDFAPEARYNEGLSTGRLSKREVFFNRKGAVRPIQAGRGFVHSLFHLDLPSVSLVMRVAVPAALPQFEYLRPGLAIRYGAQGSTLQRKKLEFIALVGKTQPAFLADYLKGLAEGASPQDVVLALRAALPYFRRDVESLNDLLRQLKTTRGALIDAAVAAFKQQGRTEVLTRLREDVHGAEPRLLMALLLHAETREELMELMKLAHPEHESLETRLLGGYEALLNELATSSDPAARELFACDKEPLLEGLALALRGDAPQTIHQTLRVHDNASSSDQADHVMGVLRRSPLFSLWLRE